MSGEQFGTIDWIFFMTMICFSASVGIFYVIKDHLNKQDNSAEEFMMGGRNMRLLPVAISILVSFVSAIFILGLPAEMYTTGTMYFLYLFGMILGNIQAALLFVPLLYPLKLTSSFEYLELRFKARAAKLTGTILMIVNQVVYMGISMFAPSTALEAVTGLPTWTSILVVGGVACFYTFLGGLKAVVWAGIFQFSVMVSGLLAIVVQGTLHVNGLAQVWKINDEWKRIQFWEADGDPTLRHSVWSLVLGGTVSWFGTYGVNQASVQKYSSLPTLCRARIAVMLNIGGVTFLFFVTSLAGIVMFAYYADKGCDPYTSGQVSNSNQLIPYFVMEILGYPGLPGLFISCLFSGALSTTSASLNSLSTVTWEDFLKPLMNQGMSDGVKVAIIRGLIIFYGALGVGFALIARSLGGTVVQATLSFNGASTGPLLGIFLLGAVFPLANWQGCVFGGMFGLALPLWISIGAYNLPSSGYGLDFPTENCPGDNATLIFTTKSAFEPTGIERMYSVSYLWMSCIGAVTTITVGLLVSLVTGPTQTTEIDQKYIIPLSRWFLECVMEVHMYISTRKVRPPWLTHVPVKRKYVKTVFEFNYIIQNVHNL